MSPRPAEGARQLERLFLRQHVQQRETISIWTCLENFGHQAVVWQTAVMPAVAIELIGTGVWHRPGVVGPEALPPMPFLDLLDAYGSEWEWADYQDRKPVEEPAA